MNIGRRAVAFACLCVLVSWAAPTAQAQDYPSRPVRILSGFPPGGATDLVGRLLADHLSHALGQPFVVENRTGASGIVAGQALIAAPADGHTLYVVNFSIMSTSRAMYPSMAYDPATAFVPITLLARAHMVLEVGAQVPAKSYADFLAYARANSGKLNHGSPGVGTLMHLCDQLFSQRVGFASEHVPYRGVAPFAQGLAKGEVQWGFDSSFSALQVQRAGQGRPIATATAQRLPAFPDVPTLAELGMADAVWSNWFGLVAAAGTPKPIVDRIAAEAAAGWKTPEVAERIRNAGFEPETMTPDETARFFAAERARWTAVVKANNLKAE